MAKPAAKQAAPGMESPSTTGRTTMRPKSPRAASRHLDAARVPPLHRLLGAAGKRRAAQGLFGTRMKKPRDGAAATRREEAAAKAARFRKTVKQPQTVST